MSTPEAKPLRLGLLQYGVGRPASVAAFGRALEARLEEGRAQADLLVLPEYACVELGAALAGGDATDEAAELAAMIAAAPEILEAMRAAARRMKVWLLPGTLPMRRADGRVVNRAPLITPEGLLAFQEKRAMTRFETERWGVTQGADPGVFDTPWGRIGVSVCYDVEFPKHVRVQVQEGAWLVLAPSCTDTMHGFNRVRIGAAARAMENQCYVAITPTVGEAPWSAALDVNRGFAAVFGPVDRGFPEDGVLARGALDAEQWVFCTLDPARIAAVRRDGQVRNHHDWPAAPFERPAEAVFA
ncbi:carbon-nitrogen hydrolase family protein [Neoroseomonas eburnea]|uniref:carbon-nitrogen hydrolase family protein n=1 Tax=Neoroseomonas eburnea TaxID=1346889 RepID=UPI0030B9CB52